MARVVPSALIQILLMPLKKNIFRFIFADDIIWQKLSIENLFQYHKNNTKIYEGKNALVDCLNNLSQGNLFFAPNPSIILIKDKKNVKQLNEDKQILLKLSNSLITSIYVILPTTLRTEIKETDIAKYNAEHYLCYSPNEGETIKCLLLLMNRYQCLSKISQNTQKEMAYKCYEYYSGDLYACDMHFERIQKTNINFNEAFIGQTEMSAFEVVNALSEANIELVELRLLQCLQSGEEISKILYAINHFFLQLIKIHASLEQTRNLDLSFKELNISFPFQARLKKALKKISITKLKNFYYLLADIELELRQNKDPYQYLASELNGLLS